MNNDPGALLMIVFLFGWLIPSITLVPFVARHRDGSWGSWIIASLLCSPLLTLIALAALPDQGDLAADDDRLPCPFCAENIKAEAVLCPHCRSDLRAADRRARG